MTVSQILLVALLCYSPLVVGPMLMPAPPPCPNRQKVTSAIRIYDGALFATRMADTRTGAVFDLQYAAHDLLACAYVHCFAQLIAHVTSNNAHLMNASMMPTSKASCAARHAAPMILSACSGVRCLRKSHLLTVYTTLVPALTAEAVALVSLVRHSWPQDSPAPRTTICTTKAAAMRFAAGAGSLGCVARIVSDAFQQYSQLASHPVEPMQADSA